MHESMVVIADSDAAVLELMQELLDTEGYATQAFHSLTLPLDDLQQLRPSLFIIEATHRHPSTTLDLVDQVRRGTNTNTSPIIVNSTSQQVLHDLSEQLVQRGCLLIEKPFDVDAFLNCISYAMETDLLAIETPAYVVST